MATPKLYCIHGADVPQHLGKIQQISQKFKQQQRITEFVPLAPEGAITQLPAKFTKNDLIVLLLSYDLEKKRKEITSLLLEIKAKFPDSTIAEIIIDNLPFVNDYVTLPRNLQPIRNVQNMDAAWREIEEDLDKLLPIAQTDWKKYLKYAIPVVVAVVALLIWRLWPKEGQKGPDDLVAAFSASATECKAPCTVDFKNTSSEGSSYQWDFDDGGVSSEANPTHVFEKAGSYNVKLVASKDGKQSGKTQAIRVSEDPTPTIKPKAAFSSDKTSCNAPCTIAFTNSSQNADKYRWEFGNGASSEDVNPTHTFNNSGNFNVKLTASRNNQEDVITREIVIGTATAAIARFTPSRTNCIVPCSIDFTNHSQNATSYRWEFGDGTSSTEANPSHQYNALGQYQVKLFAINNAGQIPEIKTIAVGASVNVAPLQIRTTGGDASIAAGDDEIDSDDWTSVELSYSVRIVNSGREIQLTLDWYSQERNSNRSVGNTRFKSSKTFTLYTAQSGSVIDDVQGIVLSANSERYYPGEVHGFNPFPATGSLRDITVRVDADGGHDRQQQALTATLGGFKVNLKPGN